MIGPWCGTTSTAVGTAVPALTAIEYGFTAMGTSTPLNWTVAHFTGAGLPQLVNFSWYRSVTSYPTTVAPQPTCAPRPMSAPGMPGNDPPTRLRTLPSPAVIAAR